MHQNLYAYYSLMENIFLIDGDFSKMAMQSVLIFILIFHLLPKIDCSLDSHNLPIFFFLPLCTSTTQNHRLVGVGRHFQRSSCPASRIFCLQKNGRLVRLAQFLNPQHVGARAQKEKMWLPQLLLSESNSDFVITCTQSETCVGSCFLQEMITVITTVAVR